MLVVNYNTESFVHALTMGVLSNTITIMGVSGFVLTIGGICVFLGFSAFGAGSKKSSIGANTSSKSKNYSIEEHELYAEPSKPLKIEDCLKIIVPAQTQTQTQTQDQEKTQSNNQNVNINEHSPISWYGYYFGSIFKPKPKPKPITVPVQQTLVYNKHYILYEYDDYTSTNSTNQQTHLNNLEKFTTDIIYAYKNNYSNIGILLKITCGGGSVLDFEYAYNVLLRFKSKNIEIIGLVDKISASGGYLLALACDKIIASPSACIGSIGVIASVHNWSKLGEKLGIEEKTWVSGSHKQIFPTGSAYTEQDDMKMREMTDKMSKKFIQIVCDTRKLSDQEVQDVSTARLFDSIEALELHLIDEIKLSHDFIDGLASTNNKIWKYSNNANSQDINSWIQYLLKILKFSAKTALFETIVGFKNNMDTIR